MTGYEVYDYIRRFTGNNPYIDGLYYQLESMNQEEKEWFAQIIAPHYTNLNGNIDLNNAKTMEKLLFLNNRDIDITNLIGMDFQNIVNIERMGGLQFKNNQTIIESPPIQKPLTEQEQIDALNNIIKSNMTGGLENEVFVQSPNISNVNTLPVQGWKFHISANSLEDYLHLCEIAIPEFQRLGIEFKVVKPEQFNMQMNSSQRGKAITVYATPQFNFNNLSPKLQSILSENSIEANNDMHIQGRINARYGRIRPTPIMYTQDGSTKMESYITNPYGQIDVDPKIKGLFVADFVNSNSVDSILNFYNNALQKLNETGDFKTYMQERYTMTECDAKSHSYMCIEIPAQQKDKAKELFYDANNNAFGMSMVCEPDKTAIDNNQTITLMLHKTDLPQAFYMLSNNGIVPQRPDWDIKYTYHEIAPGQKENALLLAKQLNEKYNMRAVSVVEVSTNKFVLKCDTVFNQETLDLCTERNLPIRDYQPEEKGDLSQFIEKITGRQTGFVERDITDEVQFIENNIKEVQYDNFNNDQER